ncbi:MAG: phosphate ABC transporter permease subunit PstC [Hyphomicrobium sp.]|nr:MAG: phosphate ABC transporter permease subunit PstC [Hyphomicrobium sp.]
MISSKSSFSFLWRNDKILGRVLWASACLSTALLILIAMFLVKESWPVLTSIGITRFITDAGWYPLEKLFGLAPMLGATVIVSTLAVLIAAPLGIASAIFCSFIAPRRIAQAYRSLIALLAGIPSVAYGLWGLTVLVPLIGQFQPPGASLLAASLILSLMILPTIALTTDAAISTVPKSYLQGATALGLTREATIIKVILPAARASIGAGILLAAARALGETMAVLMVAGNVVQFPTSLFDPMRTLTANMALEMAYATGDHRASLFVSGLMLTAIVMALATLAWRLSGGRVHG